MKSQKKKRNKFERTIENMLGTPPVQAKTPAKKTPKQPESGKWKK